MTNPFALQIFYPDGDPENIRVVEQLFWTGKVFYISRDFWPTFPKSSLPELPEEYSTLLGGLGVYGLVETRNGETTGDASRLYVGKAESLCKRIDQHINDKREFQFVVCITASDLEITHANWIESVLLEKAKDTARVEVVNQQQPKRPKVSVADESSLQELVKKLELVFPMVGLPNVFFTPMPAVSSDAIEERADGTRQPRDLRVRILSTFQKKEGVLLDKQTSSKFFDDKTRSSVRVWCPIASRLEDGQVPDIRGRPVHFRFPAGDHLEFLQYAEKGYVVLGMRGQSRAIAITVDEIMSEAPREKGPSWLYVNESNGKFSLSLPERDWLDLDPYLFDIEDV